MFGPKYRLTPYDEGSVRDTPSSLCFSSLPAELRNNAYMQTLRYNGPLILTYNVTTRRFEAPRSAIVEQRTPLQALELLSNLDHYIRQEARSYFFATNSFEIKTKQTFTTDLDYVQIYIKFLENIGETGRRSLRNLRLIVSGDSKAHRPKLGQALKLWELLASCMNLERLDLFLEVDYFYLDRPKALRSYLSTRGRPIRDLWPVVIEALRQFRSLKHLFLHVVYSSRWRHIEAYVHSKSTLGRQEPKRFERIRFQVHRPIDEAARLTDQIKGMLRAGLRGRIAIQTLTTETWDLYGADMLFNHVSQGAENLEMLQGQRWKPLGRLFTYSNGFDREM